MSTTTQPQTSIYETTIDDAALEQLLEQRQTLKDKRADANRKYKETTDLVKLKITELDLGDAPVRVGRFVISEKTIEARSVQFDVDASSRLQISLLPEDQL